MKYAVKLVVLLKIHYVQANRIRNGAFRACRLS